MVKVIIKENRYSSSGVTLKASSGAELMKLLEMAADGGNEIAEVQLREMFANEGEEASDEL